ncbi:hypothetical protein [Bartonella sp. ML70XJBT]|uniref:hypothetical protein n=1 Tax=Bartonella sp. ML70XJBT TaxID=3019096 RepID=UPI002361C02C|nr:hypothetical protein [Bartonella sp. ML70XJBT]
MKKEPAYTIIKYLGGAVNVSRILQKCKGAVYRITYSKEKGGANGLFPSIYQAQLLTYAREHGIDLRPEDFFYPERLQRLMEEQASDSMTKFSKSPCVDSACDGLQP